jgi:hypothetical protein
VVAAVAGLDAGSVPILAAGAAPVDAPAASTYAVFNCSQKPEIRPVDFTSACADNGFGVTRMRWSSWTSHSAVGYDTVYENDDYPDHAEGSIHRVRARIILWGSAGERPSGRADLQLDDGHLPGARPLRSTSTRRSTANSSRPTLGPRPSRLRD